MAHLAVFDFLGHIGKDSIVVFAIGQVMDAGVEGFAEVHDLAREMVAISDEVKEEHRKRHLLFGALL